MSYVINIYLDVTKLFTYLYFVDIPVCCYVVYILKFAYVVYICYLHTSILLCCLHTGVLYIASICCLHMFTNVVYILACGVLLSCFSLLISVPQIFPLSLEICLHRGIFPKKMVLST